MQKQCNFLTYLYREYDALDYESMYATGSELLPAFSHLSFYLIHSETRLSYNLKLENLKIHY